MAKILAMFDCRCERCHHTWQSKRYDKALAHLTPGRCPRCKSPYWRQARRTPKPPTPAAVKWALTHLTKRLAHLT